MKRENNFYGMNIKINSNNIFNNYNLNTDKTLKIKIQEKEYELNDPNLIQTLISLIMTNGNLNSKQNININTINKRNDFREFCTLKKNLFSFPKELDKNTLELFIYLLSSHLDKNINLCSYIRKLINICIHLNLYDIIKKEVEEYLLPQISKNNCIEIVLNFMDLIFKENVKNYFIKLIKASISTIAHYLPEFINTKKDSLLLLSNETLEEIVEIYIENKSKKKEKNHKNTKLNKDIEEKNIKNILNLLMYVRNIKRDMFYLLENERKTSLKNFESLINDDKDYEPKFIWKIKSCDISKEIYQEYRLSINDINLLLIYYYEPKSDNFQLALQILGINTESKDNTELKNLLDITTSSNKHIENKNIKLLSGDEDNNEIELKNNNNYWTVKKNNFSENNEKIKTKDNDNNINLIDIISILYSCEIPEIGFKSKINFNCVKQGCKSKFLIFKLENFSKLICFSDYDINNKKVIDFSIKFFFERNYIFSSIISHICNNLEFYTNLNSVNKLPKLALSLILKNEKSINSTKEEYNKLLLIKNWLKNKNNCTRKNIIEVYKLIKWQNLSTNDLLDFFIINSKLLISIKELKNDIFYEIQRRFQSEYFNFFQNDKILLSNLYTNTESNTESFRINNISKLDNKNNNSNSFTFDFLTKLLSQFSVLHNSSKSSNNTNREKSRDNQFESLNHDINYATPMQEGRNVYQLINNRNFDNYNYVTKRKISKSIRLNESPFYQEYNQNNPPDSKILIKDIKNINNKNKRNYQLSKNKSSRQNIAIKNLSMLPNNNINNNNGTKKIKKNNNSSAISNFHNISVKNPDTEEKKNYQTSNKKYNLENYISNKSSKKNSSTSNFNMNIKNFNEINSNYFNNNNQESKYTSLIINHNNNKMTNKIMNKKNHSKSVDRNLDENSRRKNNSLAEKNTIYLINNYLNGNKEKEKKSKNKNYNSRGSKTQKGNISKETKINLINNININNNITNNKKSINNNNRSRAKLIKSFNSLFSSRKRLKKNASESKVINPKIKRNNIN
jgi:hypothetical protein